MSFFKKLNAQSVTAAVASSDKPVEVVPAAILPPDAPKSDPAIAAKPVEGFDPLPPKKEHKMPIKDVPGVVTIGQSAVEVKAITPASHEVAPPPAKRGPGRPPGSKNKAKIVGQTLADVPVSRDLAEAAQKAVEKEIDAELVADMGPNPHAVRIKSVTVSKGFTVNLGSFNNVRFDVSVTAEGSDLETVYSTLMGEVEERLAAEASKYEAEVDQKTKAMKPAVEVVAK